MKLYGTTYLAGMLSLFLAERMLSTSDSSRYIFDAIGIALLLFTLFLCRKEHDPQNKASCSDAV